VIALLTGIAEGMLIFVVASGLTLVLGVMRVVNFAHGGFFLIGAYLSYELQRHQSQPVWLFVLLVIAAGLGTAIVGAVAERFLFRRLYNLSDESMLLGTFALLLVLQGAVQQIWGFDQKTQPRPSSLSGSFSIGGAEIPRYDVLLAIVGLIIFAGLLLITHRTALGKQLSAVAEDRYMAGLLGIRVTRVYAVTFALGIFLAGLGGALAAPTLSIQPDIALTFILYAFAVVIIGGFGSISGSLIASLVIGILDSMLATYYTPLANYSLYLPMVVILVLRPQGLLGRRAVAGADI